MALVLASEMGEVIAIPLQQGMDDIAGVASWPADSGLGDPSHLAAGAGTRELVVALRGDLFLRYPTTLVYAAPGAADGTVDASKALLPMFRGSVDPDVTFLGFALSEEAALDGTGWFFVFEQDQGAPRFGLDEEPANGTATSAADLAW